MVEVEVDIRWPDPRAKLLASDNLAGAFEKQLEHAERLDLQPNALAVSRELECLAAQFELRETEIDALGGGHSREPCRHQRRNITLVPRT